MPSSRKSAAVFLDRDGVLIEDVDLLTEAEKIRLLPGAAAALKSLAVAGFKLIVVSNQTVVARGLATEVEVQNINSRVNDLLVRAGAPSLDAFYFCPHHPNATVSQYRVVCECRKPKPGLLVRAAREHALDLPASFAVGDRITDIIAGAKAGCRTVLVQTGKHTAAPIETAEPLDNGIQPNHVCGNLTAAARWILEAA